MDFRLQGPQMKFIDVTASRMEMADTVESLIALDENLRHFTKVKLHLEDHMDPEDVRNIAVAEFSIEREPSSKEYEVSIRNNFNLKVTFPGKFSSVSDIVDLMKITADTYIREKAILQAYREEYDLGLHSSDGL